MHKTIALVLYSFAVVIFVAGSFWGGVALAVGGLFAQFFGKRVEGES